MTVCPRCGRQDTVHKVSEWVAFGSIPAEQPEDAPSSNPQKAGENRELSMQQRRELAQRLYITDDLWLEMEKKEVAEKAPGNRANRTLSILLCALAGFFLVNQIDAGWAWLGLIVGMLLGGVVFNYLPNRVRKKVRSAARLTREKAMQRYAAMYYCIQDDLAFLPEEDLAAPAEKIIDLLYAK